MNVFPSIRVPSLCLNFKQKFPNNLIAIILYRFTQGLDSLNSEMSFVNYVSCKLMSASFYLFINNKVAFICILLSRFISNKLIFITFTMNINRAYTCILCIRNISLVFGGRKPLLSIFMLLFPVLLCLINLYVDRIFSFGSHKHIRRDFCLSFHAFDQVNFRVRFSKLLERG